MSMKPATLGGVADPRLSVEPDAIGSKEYETETVDRSNGHAHNTPARLFDPSVTFEEYHYYATQERLYEKGISPKSNAATTALSVAIGRVMNKKERRESMAVRTGSVSAAAGAPESELATGTNNKEFGMSPSPYPGVISDEEWHTAARAARTATWGAIFYLITTDILGPFSVPYAFAQLGYGPGTALYVVFAAMATYAGFQLYWQFLGLDSSKFPVTGYGDLAFRIYGSWFRHLCNIFQSFQFFLNVSLIIVSSGQALAQLASGPSGTGCLCFVAAEVIFMAVGFGFGQIRTLQKFSHLANFAIWLNVFVIFMTMGIVANSEPNWEAAFASGYTDSPDPQPILHTAGIPDGKGLVDNVNGLMQAVFSYGGATLYMNLMAEMRRPFDFWKALLCANIFIFLCYLIFGIVVYSYQGQVSFNPAYQGINPYNWQTVANVFELITLVIAAVLYGNIGIKVLYANVGREFLKFPALESRKGKLIWVGFVPLYWALAFIVAAAIPQVTGLSAFVGAAFILQFSYTFPPILMVGYNVLADSLPADGGFNPTTGVSTRDPIRSRLWRGYKKQFVRNTFDMIFFLGSLTTAILGLYTSIQGMISFFQETAITPFTCISPTGGGCSPPAAA